MAPAGAMAPTRANRTADLSGLLLEQAHELFAEALTSTVPSTPLATAAPSPFDTTLPPEPVVERTAAMFVYALFLVLIPTATILGNALVILSVLRFKALHSAINFLILGLAVADLFVAVFVMPYAVYVYIQGGNWFLGNLMCDIYNASDVACSTASIFLLAVISFDRYRAVSRPIQYSRQSQNIRRVIVILVLIWVVSLALASPIVLGLNHRPPDASPYECRFYNPEFSVGSSIVSFIVPCIIVLFVYIRIMMALRKREKAAKMRRLASQQQDNRNDGSTDEVDAGQIVAAPDDHDVGNSSSPLSSSDSLSDNIHVVTNDFVSEAPTSMSRKSSEYESQHTNGTHPGHPHNTYHSRNRRLSRESSLLRNPMKRFKSLHVSPRNIALPTVDIARPADIWRHFSRRSPRIFGPQSTPSPKIMQKKYSYAEEGLFSTTTPLLDAGRRKSDTSAFAQTPPNGAPEGLGAWVTEEGEPQRNIEETEEVAEPPKLPLSPKSPAKRFEGALTSAVLGEEMDYVDVDSMQGSLTGKKKIQEAAIEEEPANPPNMVSSDEHSALNDATIATDSGLGPDSREHNEVVITNLNAMEAAETPRKISKSKRHEEAGSPTVTFKIPGKHREKSSRNDRPMKRLSSAAQIYENKRTVDKTADQEADLKHKRSFSQRLRGSLGAVVGPTNSRSEHSMDSCYSSSQSQGTNTTVGAGNSSGSKESKKGKVLANSKANGSTTELAVRMVKKAINRKESSLKRKVNKAQRKEKRATKTLGIVVGIFLICWVPFFFINILSGICIKLNIESCQVGFGPFFYATWIGYMNSFMNPVIYTIFNTEFRRAFKSLLLGKSNNRRNRGHPV